MSRYINQAGTLASEEQTEAVAASDHKVAVTVSDKKHWSVELAEAMEEVVRATDAHTKAAAQLTTATAALTRAQSNAENSILGTDA